MRRTFWPWLALTAVLLAGCSDDPEPKEPDPSGNTSPEPTATPPPLPEAATQETPEGAAAFVDHYLAVLTYAAQTGDTSPLGAISDGGCGGCATYMDQIGDRHAAGGWRVGGEWSAGEIQVSPFGPDMALVTEFNSAPGTVKEDADEEPRDFESSSEIVTFVASFDDGSWQMLEFALGDQS